MPKPWPAPDEKKAGPRACRRGMRRPFQGGLHVATPARPRSARARRAVRREPAGRCLLRHVRERSGPAARALAGRHAPVRGRHAGRSARDLRRLRRGADACGLRSRRPRAGRGRGAHQRRGVGGEPPLRQREHRRRRLRTAAGHAHAPRRGRAARHRVRRFRRQPGLHHDRAPRGSDVPTSGCSTRTTSAPRSAAHGSRS